MAAELTPTEPHHGRRSESNDWPNGEHNAQEYPDSRRAHLFYSFLKHMRPCTNLRLMLNTRRSPQ